MSGVVYLSAKIAEKMLMSPLNACSTYLGLDSGARPMQVGIKQGDNVNLFIFMGNHLGSPE